MAEFKYCGAEEVRRIAQDANVSVSELRNLVSHNAHSAELLGKRMAALDLDQKEVAGIEPQVFRDMQRVCTMCESHGRCMLDLARDPTDTVWKSYCPNADTLTDLHGLPWASRREF